jgi:hypothetical protein
VLGSGSRKIQMFRIELGPLELIQWLAYLTIGALILYVYKYLNNDKQFTYLLPGYFAKSIGGFIFTMIYVFYYDGEGDTFFYYEGSLKLANIFWQSPKFYFDLMIANSHDAQAILKNGNEFIQMSATEEEWFMVRLISPLTILGLRTYLGVTFFMSFISFLGSYKIYQLMINIMGQERKKLIFIINFLIPSVLFWGSGLLKDTITLSCFYFFLFFMYQILILGKIRLRNIFFILLFGLIIFQLKAYILICLILWFFVVLFFVFIKKSKNPIVKFLMLPYLLVFVIGTGYSGLQLLLVKSDEYKSELILSKIEGYQSYHQSLGGSVYNLGQVEYTEIGLLKKFPQALNVSLFRPYPWESNTFMVLINSMESMILLFFLFYVLFKFKFSFFKELKNSPFLIGAFIFILIFSFFIGITSYNFGALSRFKLPIDAFSFFILYYIYVQKKIKNKLNGNELFEK